MMEMKKSLSLSMMMTLQEFAGDNSKLLSYMMNGGRITISHMKEYSQIMLKVPSQKQINRLGIELLSKIGKNLNYVILELVILKSNLSSSLEI
jgi:hypothetical protein